MFGNQFDIAGVLILGALFLGGVVVVMSIVGAAAAKGQRNIQE